MPSINGHPAYNYSHFNAAGGPTTLKPGPGFLRTVTVNTLGTTPVITLADGANTIAVITPTVPGTWIFDVAFLTNLQVTVAGTSPDITVSWE